MAATTTRRKARESPVQGGPLVVVDPTAKPEKTSYAQLLREAEQRGVDVAELHEGGDFVEIDHAASDHWADAIAFAGVDETQAKAVTVASGRELPYTCIPTGRDDYFARDLGVAPDDGLDALDDYSEYYVDLVEVNGVTIPDGGQIMLLYPSANRDEDIFEDPHAFNIQRANNEHIAFGFGPHVCIGLALARLEMKHFLGEFAARVGRVELTQPTTWVKNNFLGGPKSMRVKCAFIT